MTARNAAVNSRGCLEGDALSMRMYPSHVAERQQVPSSVLFMRCTALTYPLPACSVPQPPR